MSQQSDNQEPENKENLPYFDERQQNYREYLTLLEEPSLYECLHAPGPSVMERMHVASSQKQNGQVMEENRSSRNMRRFQQTCANFEDALLKLPNLQSFTADFTSYSNTWRNIEGIDDEEYPDTALPE